MATTELRRSTDGRIWAHGIKKDGSVKQCGSVVSEQEALALVDDGEARWEKTSAPRSNVHSQSLEEYVHDLADNNPKAVPTWAWGIAMNRDD
jgi:hypothetical protein